MLVKKRFCKSEKKPQQFLKLFMINMNSVSKLNLKKRKNEWFNHLKASLLDYKIKKRNTSR